METTRDHHRLQVSLTYPWQGKRVKRCFEIKGGEPVPTPCARGLGDAMAAATKAVGVKPCGGCRKRQRRLNRATPSWLARLLARLVR